MTIEQYLQGKVDYELSEKTMASILFDRSVAANTLVENTTLKQRELCLADIYMFLATSSTSTSGEYESDGGWQRQHSNKNVVDRGAFRAMAQALYDKWSEQPLTTAVGVITSKTLY